MAPCSSLPSGQSFGPGARVAAADQPARDRDMGAPGDAAAADPLRSWPNKPIRVLLVDDHRVVREALAMMLEGEPDLTVIGQAANGRVAVDLVAELAPDVVLMDVNMPILNGIQATRRIRAAFPAVQVIALSVDAEPDRVAAMRTAGVVAYVTKSASASELVAAIRSALRR